VDLREIGLGSCRLDSTGSGQGPVASCCECGDEPSGSCATELVSYLWFIYLTNLLLFDTTWVRVIEKAVDGSDRVLI
jgi:hypothetical protein